MLDAIHGKVAVLVLIGVLAGTGQLLSSRERLTWRLVIGRALTSGMLAMVAGTALLWFPEIPDVALYGVAAGVASLGTSGLERLLQRFISGKN